MQAFTEISNLQVYFGTLKAVDNINIQIGKGEVHALVGPNGAGKTTTMRAIVGLQPISAGKIQIKGLSLLENPEAYKSKFGFMPDFFPVYEKLKVWEYLDHFARAYDVDDPASKIKNSLELVNLTEKKDNYCSELSRGMKQRLMFAKTLIHDPELIILDEPASGLDPKGRIDLKEIIDSLRKEGRSFLVSSHILNELTDFCTHAIIMEKGRIVKSGPIGTLRNNKDSLTISLKWDGNNESIINLLEENPYIQKIEKIDHSLGKAHITCQDKKWQANKILKTLIEADINILEWRITSEDLEQVYLEAGANEVS